MMLPLSSRLQPGEQDPRYSYRGRESYIQENS